MQLYLTHLSSQCINSNDAHARTHTYTHITFMRMCPLHVLACIITDTLPSLQVTVTPLSLSSLSPNRRCVVSPTITYIAVPPVISQFTLEFRLLRNEWRSR